MDLLERYVHDVGQWLPRRMRADVEAELRSLLGDAVEERARAAGRPEDAEIATGVLREFGAPREVAARYAGEPRCLIGPRLLPAYLLTLKIAGIALAAVFAVLAVARLRASADAGGAGSAIRSVVHAAGHTLYGAFFNLGVLTLIFAVVERLQARREATAQAFDPARLPPIKDPDRVSVVGMVFSTYAIVAVAVLFNFFPQAIGIWSFDGERWRSVLPIILPAFSAYLPALNVLWGLTLALDLVVLAQGRWRRSTRWMELALGGMGIAVLVVVMLGPPVFAFDSAMKSVLVVPLLIAVLSNGARLFRLLARAPAEPFRG